MIQTHLYLKLAAGCYGLSLAATFLPKGRRNAAHCFLLPAVGLNALAAALRYYQAWPMLPMYLGPVAVSALMGLLVVMTGRQYPDGIVVRRIVLAVILVISAAAVFFPKDYYLPFIKSRSAAAHLFFWFGTAGRGCFMIAAAWAAAGLLRRGSGLPLHAATRWIVWGFAFFTLSMFAGELWSYLGWGTPVVWDDPAITTTMATWFFYICWLHLHLTGTWNVRSRSIFAAGGAPAVFALNLLPELGPFRWPF